MSKGEYIDWNEIRTAYNRIKGTNFKTVERFVRSLYKETGSLSKMERDLGISLPTISKKLKSYSIEVKGKGGNNRSGETKKSLFLKIPPEKMRKMTKLEISKECEGASIHYIENLIHENGREFLKVRNGGIYHAEKTRSRNFSS